MLLGRSFGRGQDDEGQRATGCRLRSHQCETGACVVAYCQSWSRVSDVANNSCWGFFRFSFAFFFLQLDDCWGLRNPTTHEIEGDPLRFPEGMKAFIKKVHDLGFKFGLYTGRVCSVCVLLCLCSLGEWLFACLFVCLLACLFACLLVCLLCCMAWLAWLMGVFVF